MIWAVEFDFASRRERELRADEISAACARGAFCWIDIDCGPGQAKDNELPEIGKLLRGIGINELATAEVLGSDQEGRYDVYDDCLHFALTESRLVEGRLATAHVDIVLGARFIVTFRRSEAGFIRQMRKTYREDFLKFAKSPGFLLYEVGDHLVETYRKTLREYSTLVEQTQLRLFGEVDDDIFKQVAALKTDILEFRRVMLASRELMHELATRKSPFISETTQPFLENMAGTLERLGSDLSTERDVLSETLGLYMGMVSHRTNKVVSRLTVISMVFLPLSFLCGVYGTNFQDIPGTGNEFGFLGFCTAMAAVALGLMALMKKLKWL